MQDFDHGFKEVAQRASRALSRVAEVECDTLKPIGGEVQATTERLADRAFIARRGRERFVIYFEAFARWNRHTPLNLLAKAGLLAERERLPVLPIVFILRRRGYRSQGGRSELTVKGEVTQLLRFREVPLWEVIPQPWWEDTPELMALYPLCRHGPPPRESIVHATEVIEHRIGGGVERADALILLDLFGEMAYPRLDVEAIIGSEKMLESKIGRSMQRRGQLQQARMDILLFLRKRFGPETLSDLESVLGDIDSLETLNTLLDHAVDCRSLAAFRTELPVQPRRR